MKKLLILIFFVLSIFYSNAQSIFYRAEYIAIKMAGYNWSEWASSDVLLILDTKTQLLSIYSVQKQEYHFISQPELRIDLNSESMYFNAINEEKEICTIEIKKFNEGYLHLYIRKREYEIAYQMKNE